MACVKITEKWLYLMLGRGGEEVREAEATKLAGLG